MARTQILATAPPPRYGPWGAGSALLVFTVADIVNFNSTPLTGRELLIVNNTDAGIQTVTVNSVGDPQGRTGDITAYSLPIASFAVFGPFPVLGWRQADGNLYYQSSAITVKFAVISLPAVA